VIDDSSVVRITSLSIDDIAAIPQNRGLPLEGSMFSLLLVATLLSWGLWSAFGRPKTAFLSRFATLLDRPEFVHGVENTLAKRAFLKGEFRGRKVVVLLQNGRGKYARTLVVSMETHAPVTMESYAFTGYRSDREGELALFALEVKHECMLRHEEGCLKARWAPQKVSSLFNFPPNFDPQKWQSILEAMHTLAGSIERRAGALSRKIGTHTTEVSSVSTAPIPDSLFEIPAGYTVIKR
jgi:hypothetical protein